MRTNTTIKQSPPVHSGLGARLGNGEPAQAARIGIILSRQHWRYGPPLQP